MATVLHQAAAGRHRPDDAVPNYAHITECLDYEVELVAIIGREGKNISESDALSHVFGLTIGNDITARDIQCRHEQWFKGKGLDRSCPRSLDRHHRRA
jgi:2-keto-4-pentenoate hydratase/2-oxohepta-3-ene-1,7-dioic acid hydratase in catechol pathway